MPYKSRAQQGLFHYLESKGKMPKKTVDEFDEATNYKHLPEHVDKAFGGEIEAEEHEEPMEEMPEHPDIPKNFAHGGMAPEENFDVQEGEAEEYDSSGEPHTEDDLEDEKPMEYMAGGGIGGLGSLIALLSKGGKVKKMAHGGGVSGIGKALRKARY